MSQSSLIFKAFEESYRKRYIEKSCSCDALE